MNISQFQSSINKKGVLPTNRFIARFGLPAYLRGRQDEAGILLKNQTEELITLRCEAALFPGMSITPLEQPRLGYGPLEFMPHNVVLDDVTLTFLVDGQGDIHRLFYEWINTMVNLQGSRGQSRLNTTTNYGNGSSAAAFEVGYKDLYSTDIDISVYDRYNRDEQEVGTEIMRIKLFKAHPMALPSMNLAWASNDELVRLTVPFKYTDFYVDYMQTGDTFTAGVVQPSSLPNFQKSKELTIEPPPSEPAGAGRRRRNEIQNRAEPQPKPPTANLGRAGTRPAPTPTVPSGTGRRRRNEIQNRSQPQPKPRKNDSTSDFVPLP